MLCHAYTQVWLFAGTVFQKGGTLGAAHVQLGVRDPSGLRLACSASNGNFWVPQAGPPVDWDHAEIRVRGSGGETVMKSHASAACNGCHAGALTLFAP
jgi:hypothetical protein